MVYEGRRSAGGTVRRRSSQKSRRESTGGTLFKVCLWIFLLAVAIRLAWPEAADKIGARAAALLGNPDLSGAVEVFSDRVSGGEGVIKSLREAVKYAFHPDEGDAVQTSGDVTDDPAASDGEGADTAQSHQDTASRADDDPVAAFKESQAEFASYGIPQNVTYEKPEIAETLTLPVSGPVTSGFGYREHPSDGKVRFHYGLDIGAKEGSEAAAALDGTVAAVGDSTTYGLYVILEHEDGLKSLYAHLQEISVSDGDTVAAGQTVGLVGSTGNATGPCLHLELIVGGSYVNPSYYLPV